MLLRRIHLVPSVALVALAVVASAAALAPVRCQAGSKPETYGVRVGWISAHFNGDYGDAFPDSRSDFTAAGYTRFALGRSWSLQPELGWTPKGGSGSTEVMLIVNGTPTPFLAESNHRIEYLEMPLLLRLDVPTHSRVTPYALLGPALAFRVGTGRSRLTFTSIPSGKRGRVPRPTAVIFEGAGTFDQEFEAQPIDTGAIGGLGAWFEIGSVRWGFEGRYTYGLLDVRTGEGFAARNSALALTTSLELR